MASLAEKFEDAAVPPLTSPKERGVELLREISCGGFNGSLGTPDWEKVFALIDSGAALDEKDEDNWIPLTWACHVPGGQAAAVALIEHGASVDRGFRNPGEGITFLMHAAMRGDLTIVNALISRGVMVNEWDNDGWTALMYAARNATEPDAAGIVRALLDAGANESFKNKAFQSSLDILKIRDDNPEIETLLLAKERRAEQARQEHAQWVKDACPAKEPISMKTIRPVKRRMLLS